MSKHAPQVLSGRQLINLICDQNLESKHRQFFSSEGDPLGSVYDQFFIAEWPECCTTMQHLSDAAIHGPYESESEAMSCHDGAEIY
jgi:hypothetical protein